ncbi:Hypothetical protein GbCGDNIH9_8580 [Granulibacter bethesdensis]|uniref:Uncharacterized protein n=1 Tax=Granulibacter bethesdensis TaxID=364410 RepID=A0AAC9P8R5_9PROT|nr:Hypothetical protein GbCGDNIH9_8580 [Granulibacter bethesdensis]APH62398.1 Hypothetical protein GbCGDNIH8_8580 [Granulibacter bethesdensis]
MHLHIVCTDPDDGYQLIVSICTRINNLCDPSCILQPHEHPFLTKESYVLYREAKLVQHSALTKGVAENRFILKEDMNGQTFLRITKGICTSIQTSRHIKKYFGCQNPVSTAAA